MSDQTLTPKKDVRSDLADALADITLSFPDDGTLRHEMGPSSEKYSWDTGTGHVEIVVNITQR